MKIFSEGRPIEMFFGRKFSEVPAEVSTEDDDEIVDFDDDVERRTATMSSPTTPRPCPLTSTVDAVDPSTWYQKNMTMFDHEVTYNEAVRMIIRFLSK
jgi:hypothetical protein